MNSKNSGPLFFCHSPRLPLQRRGVRLRSAAIFLLHNKNIPPLKDQGWDTKSYSTVPPCLHPRRGAARVLCNGRSRPSLHIGGRLQGGGCAPGRDRSRLQPTAAPLCCHARTASFSMPFQYGASYHLSAALSSRRPRNPFSVQAGRVRAPRVSPNSIRFESSRLSNGRSSLQKLFRVQAPGSDSRCSHCGGVAPGWG